MPPLRDSLRDTIQGGLHILKADIDKVHPVPTPTRVVHKPQYACPG